MPDLLPIPATPRHALQKHIKRQNSVNGFVTPNLNALSQRFFPRDTPSPNSHGHLHGIKPSASVGGSSVASPVRPSRPPEIHFPSAWRTALQFGCRVRSSIDGFRAAVGGGAAIIFVMLQIGPISLESPFVQAALSGYSDRAMRLLSRHYGCPYALAEVILDRMVFTRGRKTRIHLDISPHEHPVGGQLMGSEPEQFAEAAVELVDRGFDVIDINFGCPVRKVLGRCRGGFLLSTPETAIEILRRVYDAVGSRVPVTVKMRRGMDDTSESERNFFTILDAAFAIGLSAATVHGRTVQQRYIGPSRWEFLSRVKRHVGNRTIIGSGDAFSAGDCVRMLEETGIDGVSVARGAIGNPWIFREAQALHARRAWPEPPSIAEQRAGLERHFSLMCELHGEDRAPLLLKKFAVRYSELHPLSRDVKMAFLTVKSPGDWRAMLDQWYDPAAEWPAVLRRERPEALIAAGAAWECGA